MVRHTEHHQFPVPEPGDPNYAETFDQLIDEIDLAVILKGPIGNRPAANLEGRWYLSTDEDPPTIYYDTGDEWISPATFGDPPDDIARRTREETIGPQWHFDEPIRGDVTGSASHAIEAAEALLAQDARQLGGLSPEAYARTDRAETFYEPLTFESEIETSKLRLTGGTMNLPSYSGNDPNDHRPGSLWFRSDRQP